MASTTELQDILATLDQLQARVRELSRPEAPAAGPAVGISEPTAAVVDPSLLATILAGVAEVTGFVNVKDYPEFFARFAKRNGLRLLLLKRWTSGLQVFMEVNVTLPPEAKKKRQDGRAPVPSAKGDIFEAVAEEAGIYAGPVPAQHFPLDLTLMLGRGSRDRRIVLLPLPTQNHWNTFLYLDADDPTAPALAAAEILAHFALARMCLLIQGVRHRQGRVESILREEIFRRQNTPALPGPSAQSEPAAPDKRPVGLAVGQPVRPQSDSQAGPQTGPPTAGRGRARAAEPENDEPSLEFVDAPQSRVLDHEPVGELDPFSASREMVTAIASASVPARPRPEPTALETPALVHRAAAAPRNESTGWNQPGGATIRLTPEMILHHSGELPALPKAACHIMAVIEDPKTTATRLEKALAMDQTLTAKVLRIANSPFYGAVREIKTVSEAIVRLGFVAIRNWTLVTAARSVFLAPGAGMLYRKIWQQSVMSAMAGQLVAQAAGRSDPESVFIGGLMQNIGQLVLARSHPEMFQEILMESINTRKPYHEVERKLLGFDHGELGALLIKDWNLSQDLEEAVYWHHNFQAEGARNARVAAMIALGEEIAWCSGGQEQTAEGDDSQDGRTEDGDPAGQVLSEAARFLGFNAGQVAGLRRQAAQLHIDPHFFN